MGKTYELICHECKSSLWVGQKAFGATDDRAYIYSTDTHLKDLRDFLFSHRRHRLEFGESQELGVFTYTEFGNDKEQKHD